MNKPQTTFCRRLTDWIVRQIEYAMPSDRHVWADAMRNEVQRISGDRDRLRWAWGCLLAGCRERLRGFQPSDFLFVRLSMAFFLLFQALDDIFATTLTMAYRTGAFNLAEGLGRSAPGDDYRRLIPLMEAAPLWLHGLWALASILYLVAISQILFRKRSPHITLFLAIAVEVAARGLGRPIIEATGIVVNPNPSLFALLLPFVLPLLIGGLLWRAHRYRSMAVPL
jgi:hypothetical protein